MHAAVVQPLHLGKSSQGHKGDSSMTITLSFMFSNRFVLVRGVA